MMLYPLVSWWLIVLVCLPIGGFVVWQLWTHRAHTGQRWAWVRRLAMVFMLFVIFLRPTLSGGHGEVGLANADIFFVVDTTVSMSAEDYDGSESRLEGVKADITELTKRLAGARFTILTFDNQAAVALPLTSDSSAVQSLTNALHTQLTSYAKGSTISQPVDLLKQEIQRVRQASPERKTLVYYFGDGEQTADGNPKSFASLASLVNGGGVLGYGTSQGGKMLEYFGYYDNSSKPEYITDYSNSSTYPLTDALSKIDEGNLHTVASQMGVVYSHQTTPGSVDTVVTTIDTSSLTGVSRDANLREDVYWIAAIAVVLLLGYEAFTLRTVLRDIHTATEKKP